MPKKGRKLRVGSLAGGKNEPFKGKRGTGTRFKKCTRSVHARNKKALCASIMRAKYGNRARKKLKR